MSFCKLCQQDKKLVKCHILPEAIHKDIYNGIALEISKDNFSKRLQIGYYDTDLACEDCEKMFHPYDDYFIDFFKEYQKNHDRMTTVKYGQLPAYKYYDVKCDLLYGFFLFHLLRASLSQIDFYKTVDLGDKYNNLLISYLKNNKSFSDNLIELIFFSYGKRTRIQKPPERARFKKINTYAFYFPGGIEIFYKVDLQSWPVDSLCLKANSNKLIIPIVKSDHLIEQLHQSDLF